MGRIVRKTGTWLGAVVLSAVVIAGWGLAQDGEDSGDEATTPAIDLPAVQQLQVDSSLSDDDVLRIIARDNLMLTEHEAALIDAAVRLAVTGADGLADVQETGETVTVAPVALRDFRLDALLYFSPTRWSLWLNSEHVTPDTMPADLRVNAIGPDYVDLVWMPDASQPQNRRVFTLRPHQIYLADTDDVVDVSALAILRPPEEQGGTIADGGGEIDVEALATPEDLSLSPAQQDQLRDLERALQAQD
ncbi:MAG: hypothetical protein AAF563_02555 [Pseudomonadota bacterium]